MNRLLLKITGIFFICLLCTVNKSFGSDKKDVTSLSEIKMANRTIDFSGITWQVRNRTGNPGGNNWSDSENSVWVDTEGILHMKIMKINDKWYCSEVFADITVGYGEYKFYVSTNVEQLNKNVVVGLFTYLNDINEIDIEFSRWGNETNKKRGNYVIQPSLTVGNSVKFALNLTQNFSTHRFIWSKNQIKFKSWYGHTPTPTDNLVIHEWDYTGKNIPLPGKELLFINLWLYQGQMPSDGKEVEVLIKAVEVNEPPLVNDLNILIPEDTAVYSTIGALYTQGYAANELNYSIIDGNENEIFSVSESGEIILENPVDYETLTSHSLRVGIEKNEMIDTATVNITVINVNDNAPAENDLSVSISEDLPVSSEIGKLSCFDADGDSLRFLIIYGNENNQYSVEPDGRIILEHQLDYETNKFDSIIVQVSDGEFKVYSTVTCHIQKGLELGLQMPDFNYGNNIYPNPATKQLNVKLNFDEAVEIQIINTEGKKFPVKEISYTKSSVLLNISELKSGNYLVLLKYQNRTEILRFSKILLN